MLKAVPISDEHSLEIYLIAKNGRQSADWNSLSCIGDTSWSRHNFGFHRAQATSSVVYPCIGLSLSSLYTLHKGGSLQDDQSSACCTCSTLPRIDKVTQLAEMLCESFWVIYALLGAQHVSFRLSQIHWLLLSATSETSLMVFSKAWSWILSYFSSLITNDVTNNLIASTTHFNWINFGVPATLLYLFNKLCIV